MTEPQDEPPVTYELAAGLLVLLGDMSVIVNGPVEKHGDVCLRAPIGEIGADI